MREQVRTRATNWPLLALALTFAACGIKGPPRPPVQVVQPPPTEQETPPRPGRDETGQDRGPFNPAGDTNGSAPAPVPVDGGSPLVPNVVEQPVPDAPPADGADAGQ